MIDKHEFVRKPYQTKDRWYVGPSRDVKSGEIVEGKRESAQALARELTRQTGVKHSIGWAGHT